MTARSRLASLVAKAVRRLLPCQHAPSRPCRVVCHPRIQSEAELLDCWHKARFHLLPGYVAEVVIPVDPSVAIARSDPARWPRPTHFTGEVPPGVPPLEIRVTPTNLSLRTLCRSDSVLVLDSGAARRTFSAMLLAPSLRDVDRHTNIWEGWTWAGFCASLRTLPERERQAEEAQEHFRSYVDTLPAYDRCYVFGTGPSLDQAWGRSFDDGYRVVCNTIVRNKALLDHIAPHFIVAADAIHHFDNNTHAAAFRADLEVALRRRELRALVPDLFYPLIVAHHPDVVSKVIPARTDLEGIHLDMKRCLAYTNLPNVLNGLLLPLASSLADDVFLLGFDGRAPGDEVFWANSAANSYPELKTAIMAAHPQFFQGMDYAQYAAEQSDNAELILAKGESLGKHYYCLNPTHIPALRKRMAPR
jgi:hypothetical protein